jgi:hypothetical protein
MEDIRKIVVGNDPYNGAAFKVGSVVGGYTINNIKRTFEDTFEIFVTDGDHTYKWKEVKGNYLIEFNLDF